MWSTCQFTCCNLFFRFRFCYENIAVVLSGVTESLGANTVHPNASRVDNLTHVNAWLRAWPKRVEKYRKSPRVSESMVLAECCLRVVTLRGRAVFTLQLV